MNYDNATDFEINKRVAELLGVSAHSAKHKLIDDAKVHTKEKGTPHGLGYSWKDYCNSWSDIGPIIEEYKIGIIPSDDGCTHYWWAFDGAGSFLDEPKSINVNPKRAAAIVFIKMMEARDD